MKNTIHNEHTGKVIDTMIRMTKVLSRYSKSITDFINLDLAEKSELSGRQIERMRKYEGYPEDKSAIKLINGVELLSFIDPTDYLRRTLINDKMIALFLKYQPRLKTVYVITRSSSDAMDILQPIAKQFKFDQLVQNNCKIKVIGLDTNGLSFEKFKTIVSTLAFGSLSEDLEISHELKRSKHIKIDLQIDQNTEYVTLARNSHMWDILNSRINIIFEGAEEIHGLKHIEGVVFPNIKSDKEGTRITFEQDTDIDLSLLDVEGWLFMKDAEIVSIMENLT